MAESRAAGGWEEGPHCPLAPLCPWEGLSSGCLWSRSAKQPHESFPVTVSSERMPLPSRHGARRASRRHCCASPVRGERLLRNHLAFVYENVSDSFVFSQWLLGSLQPNLQSTPPGGAGLDRATCDSLLPPRGRFAHGTAREDQCLTSADG